MTFGSFMSLQLQFLTHLDQDHFEAFTLELNVMVTAHVIHDRGKCPSAMRTPASTVSVDRHNGLRGLHEPHLLLDTVAHSHRC